MYLLLLLLFTILVAPNKQFLNVKLGSRFLAKHLNYRQCKDTVNALFCNLTLLLNFIPVQYPESFMLCRNVIDNVVSSEL